jgi:hypothetical protein
MARRQRDYKAEYARSKAIAQAEGYRSVREKRRQRRIVRDAGVRFGDFVADRDSTALAWSTLHSRTGVTEFDPTWTEAQKTEFYNTFVAIPNKGRKSRNIYQYLRRWDPDYADQFKDHYV